MKNVDSPTPYLANINLNNNDQGVDKVWVDYPFLLPHDVLHWGSATQRVNLSDLTNFSDKIDKNLKNMRDKLCDKFGFGP